MKKIFLIPVILMLLCSIVFAAGFTGNNLFFRDSNGVNYTVTPPGAATTLVGTDTTQTLTNKTLTSPVFTAPSLGAATATTINGNTITTGTGTLTLGTANTLAVTGGYTITLTSTGTTGVTLPLTGTLSTLAGAETLTNKTLTSPAIASLTNGGTITMPTGTLTLATLTGTETLTNKTLTTPVISSITNGALLTLPTSTDTLVGRNTTDTLTNKTMVAPALGAATGTSLALGGGTVITKIVVYSQSLTPAASSAAIQTAEQTFTVTGLATSDKVYLNGPAPTSLCPPTTYRVSAADTLAIGFTTLTAVACTPASGTYNIIAVRN